LEASTFCRVFLSEIAHGKTIARLPEQTAFRVEIQFRHPEQAHRRRPVRINGLISASDRIAFHEGADQSVHEFTRPARSTPPRGTPILGAQPS